MNLMFKILIPVLIFVGSVFAAKTIISKRPEAQTRPAFENVQSVEATRLSLSEYQVVINSQGSVRPSRTSSLVPEVTGVIKSVSPNLLVGGYFQEGELLVEIDGRDYEIALLEANAQYAQSSAVLQEEKARAAQAIQDWKSLGRKSKPTGLTARTPQLAAARASLAAARAQIQKAELDLERTKLIAPYNGRVMTEQVDEGAFVSRGSPMAEIYSIDFAEIRLPISDRQLAYLQIPEGSLNDWNGGARLNAVVGGKKITWPAQLIRSEGVDPTSQQLNVVAQIKNPLSTTEHSSPLRIGQFVQAEIEGSLLQDVFVIPRSALREEQEVLIVDAESTLQKRKVTVAWTDDKFAAISEGLAEGEVLVQTTLSAVTNGTLVRATIDGAPPPRGQGSRQGTNAGNKKPISTSGN